MAIGKDMDFQRLFQVGVYAQIEQNLYDLVLKIGEEVEPLRSNNLQRLNLPLISNEHDKADVMLAAALALRDEDLVEKVTKIFPKQKLGIGLMKFCTQRITQIIHTLESIEDPDIGTSYHIIFYCLLVQTVIRVSGQSGIAACRCYNSR